jgi:hypothetical protein
MSASRIAAGVACAPVGEIDERKAGMPMSAMSLSGCEIPAAWVSQSPARGQRGSFGNVEEVTARPILGTVDTQCENLVEYVPPHAPATASTE